MARALKIGFITERMLRGFGVDLVVHQMARGLAAYGHQVTVYASTSDDSFQADGYRLELIPTPSSPWFPRHELSAQRHLRFLNAEGNDIWLVHTFPFFSLLPRLKAPAIAMDYGVSSAAGFPLKLRANFAYLKFMQERVYFRKARHIIAISEFLSRDLPSGLREKTSVIYLGADHYRQLPAAEGSSIRAELGIGADEILMLYVGRLSSRDQPYKGTAELVGLYRRLRRENPGLRLLMTGFGGQRERDWLEGEGILVIENAPEQMMPAIFRACDLYVTASQWEGFDLPLAEAQSFGKPVVALDVGAHPEVVADRESGFLAADIDGMAAAIARLAGDPGLRSSMGEAALRKAAQFEWDKTITAGEQLIGAVADGK